MIAFVFLDIAKLIEDKIVFQCYSELVVNDKHSL